MDTTRKICQVYVPSWYRTYGKKALEKIEEYLKVIKYYSFTGVYLISVWKDGGFDNGFDIVEYTPNSKFTMYGGWQELETFVGYAHNLGLTVGADVVPNHVSDKHYLAQKCLSGCPGYEDVLFIVSEKEAKQLKEKGVPSIFGKEPYSEVEGFTGQDKFVRTTFCDGHQLNLNWNSEAVKEYFGQMFHWFRTLYHFDFMRVDSGMILHEDVEKADPNNILAVFDAEKSVKAIREVAGKMPLYFEWFPDAFSLKPFEDDPLSFALACPNFAGGEYPKEWNHPKLVPFFGGHDQMPFYNRAKIEGFDGKAVYAKAMEAEAGIVFTDLQTRFGYMLTDKDLEVRWGDECFDADLNNPNKRYAARRPINEFLSWLIPKIL